MLELKRIAGPPCPVEKNGTEVYKVSGARWVYYHGADGNVYICVTTEEGLPEWYVIQAGPPSS